MKIGRSGRPNAAARDAPSTNEAANKTNPLVRRVVTAGAVLLVVGLLAFVARHALLGMLLTRGFDIATGDRVSFGGFHIGLTRSTLVDVHVTTTDGDPLLEAKRVTLQYSGRLPWFDAVHRFGISALTVDAPVFSIVRHPDGSYNIGHTAGGGRASNRAVPSGGSATPWNLGIHVRDGEIRLIDRSPVAADLRDQRINQIALEAAIRSDRRSTLTGSAQYVSRQTAAAALERWPITLGSTIDYPRGIAIVHVGAARLPVRGAVGYLQHSTAVRVDDGLLQGVDIKLYALNIAGGGALDLHVGGSAGLAGGRLAIGALRRPVRDLRGRITLVDDGVWATRLDATLAGIPLVARGGAFDRRNPTLRLGLVADGDLRDLRAAFAFAQSQPVTGGVHVETLLEAPVSNILIRTALSVPSGAYGKVPLSDVVGRVDYHAGTIVLDGVRARYGATAIGVGGRFVLGGRALDSAIVAAASAPGQALPFAENLAPDAAVDGLALITGGAAGTRVRGALGIRGDMVAGQGMFAIDERGVGEFGPFSITRRDGSSVIGALRLERPISRSAAWISARKYRVALPARAASFPGLIVPAFPPVAGVIDASVAGGGPPSAFGLVGEVSGDDLHIGNARLGSGRALLGGTLADLRLETLAVDGPLGRFSGSGAAGQGGFAMRGRYDGSLERLVPLTGRQAARGALHGPVLLALRGSEIVVQSPGATLRGGSVRGVALDAASGTIAVRQNQFHLLVGAGSIAGRRAVAAESNGTVAVSAPDIPSAALRGTGVPLDEGNVSAYGLADLRGKSPSFDGTVTVAGGRAHGYSVTGDAQVDLDGPRARIFSATGALGSTYGSIGGAIDGIGKGALLYDLDVHVPLGDIDLLRRDLAVPVRHLAGSFAATLHVRGSGASPLVDGRVEAPDGTYNGLAFRAAGARIALDASGIAARDGTLTVGSTKVSLAASRRAGALGFSAASAAANLADFNDYFDASDTFDGRGNFDLAFEASGHRVVTSGRLDMQGVRYRDFALGTTQATWRMRGPVIDGRADVHSPAGALRLTAAIAPAPGGDPIRAFSAARYDGVATFSDVDLGKWLPAVGSSLPVLGSVDARIRVAGRLPRLAVAAAATLTNATVAGFAIPSAHLRASSLGSRINVSESDADLGFAKLAGNGKLGIGGRDPLAFDLRVSTENVGRAVRTFVPAARGLDLAGALDADVRLGGTRDRPQVQGGFDLRGARYAGFVVPRAIGALALAGTAIELRDADVEFTRGQAFVAGSLPLLLRPFGLGPPRAPLSFDVTARGVDLAQFTPLLPAGTTLGGTIDGRFGVEGSVNRPRLLGSLAVTDGSYASPFERAAIQHVGADVAFSGNSVALRTFHADVGGGTLDGRGRITLPLDDQSHSQYQAEVVAKAAKLDFPAYGRGTIDGELQLAGGTGQPVLTGDVALRDAVVPVSAVYGTSSASSGAGGGALLLDSALRIHAAVARNVRIRSAIVDIGVAGAVDLSGSLREPRLAGGFTATDGTISSYNHFFRIVNAAVSFNPADGVTPTIEARAISRVSNPDPDPSRNIAGSANIIVTVSGTADSNNLQVSYSSDPAYSQEQIIGLLLDVPALLGAVNFNLNGGPGSPLLRGAPGETNALLPPGVTPEQVSAISFNQEVFSLLNGQFTQRALNPLERAFERVLGLSDIQFTVDYGGGIGYSVRRQIGKRDFYAFLSQTVTYPERANIGFELAPRPFETVNFSYYQQNGVTSLITNATPGAGFLSSTRRLTSVQPLGNRSGFSLNLNRRF